jgi:hypothetical protein
MSNHNKSSNALKRIKEEALPEATEGQLAEVIPWPDVHKLVAERPRKQKRVRLEGKYLHYQGKKIPILQFQKSGYDKLLKLLVKEIG